MKIRKRGLFLTGLFVFILLGAAYFIKIEIDSGANYVEKTPLLGILIFYSPAVLVLYVFFGALLVFLGLRKRRILR